MAEQHEAAGHQQPIEVQHPSPSLAVVALAGEVDAQRAPDLQVSLQEAIARLRGQGGLVVDLSGVDYMDSSGVATLVRALQLTRKKGLKLVLCGLQDRVRSIVEIARLDSVFCIVPDRAQALEKIEARR
ncbi:MAG: anti-sigma factor antagonist [Phycisphaerales bacterium]|nr:MAG: anti-sigma factor antagonist [Phycisphaerales bacterium]